MTRQSTTAADNPAPGGSLVAPAGESGLIWTIWFTYGAFYFCRTNIAAAVPGLKASLEDGGLGLSGDEVGWILASLKIAYGLGQFVNGQLSERVSPRTLLAVGMFTSAGLNVLFGLSTGFYFLLFVWACNGYFQSMGWAPCMRVIGDRVPMLRRGKAIGIIGTGYQVTLGLTYILSSQAAAIAGWRAALYVPSVLLAMAGVATLVLLRTPPADQHAAEAQRPLQPRRERATPMENLFWTLFNPTLWLLGLALGLLNACRYGFLDWGVTHLMEVQGTGIGAAGLKFFVIAIGAVAGSYLAGWATDRYFSSRRAPMICVLLVTLGLLCLAYESVTRVSSVGTIALLIAIGFCIYGPQVLLVGTAAVDLAHRGMAAAAAGFVNFLGYMGAATGDIVTGHYSDPAHGGWQVAIYIWAGWALGAAAVTALLWNTTSHKVGLLPAVVPRALGLVALATALIVALGEGTQSVLVVLTLGAALCLALSSGRRWASGATVLMSLVGLLLVIGSTVQASGGFRWDQTLAIAMYALATLTATMVFIERR